MITVRPLLLFVVKVTAVMLTLFAPPATIGGGEGRGVQAIGAPSGDPADHARMPLIRRRRDRPAMPWRVANARAFRAEQASIQAVCAISGASVGAAPHVGVGARIGEIRGATNHMARPEAAATVVDPCHVARGGRAAIAHRRHLAVGEIARGPRAPRPPPLA